MSNTIHSIRSKVYLNVAFVGVYAINGSYEKPIFISSPLGLFIKFSAFGNKANENNFHCKNIERVFIVQKTTIL